MDYIWKSSQTDDGNIVGSGTSINPSAEPQSVNPYEDWEKTTRPTTNNLVKAGKSKFWQPVYVELLKVSSETYASAAEYLLDFARDNSDHLILTEESERALHTLKKGQNPKDVEANLRFFIFRPEDEAYLTKHNNTNLPYQVIEVGPAIPVVFVNKHRSDSTQKPPRKIMSHVVTAVIDDQIGFLNQRFRSARQKTRIERFWLQAMPDFNDGSREILAGIGEELTSAKIDDLLKNAWEEVGYQKIYPKGVRTFPTQRDSGANAPNPASGTNLADPSFIRPFGFHTGHGTHVLDLAAGYPVEDGRDDRPIFAVQLPELAAAETSGARLDLFVLLGVIRILHWADTVYQDDSGKPVPVSVVINISYGIHAGPKDGKAFLEREIGRLVKLRNQRLKNRMLTVVVMPSGNGFRDRTRARMVLSKSNPSKVTLRLQPEDLSTSFVEMWLPRVNDSLELTLATPQGSPATIDLSSAPQVLDWLAGNLPIGRIYVQDIAENGRRRVVIALSPTLAHDPGSIAAPNGAYGISLLNKGKAPVTVDIDVQRDDTPSTFPAYGRQAYLDDSGVDEIDPATFDRNMPDPLKSNVTSSGTMSAIATSVAANIVVVGGAFDRHAFGKAALYSGSGQGLPCNGPALAAATEESRAHPGRLASGLFSGSASIIMGTSMAAPQVTRAIVDQIVASKKSRRKPTYNLNDLLHPGHTFKKKDERLGAGVMPFRQEPGRKPRREAR